MEIEIKNIEGKTTGKKITLPEYFMVEPNDHLIYMDVKHHQANKRQGTHKAKERAEIKGSTKKIKRQKGTGTARAGSMKSPVFVGGGRVFGPRPRDYGFKLNKKSKAIARFSAFSYKAKDNDLMVLENFKMETPKTRNVISILKNLEIADKKALFLLDSQDQNLLLSSRNLKKVKVSLFKDANTYDIINADSLIITEGCFENAKTA